jgi:hypothetical protein
MITVGPSGGQYRMSDCKCAIEHVQMCHVSCALRLSHTRPEVLFTEG